MRVVLAALYFITFLNASAQQTPSPGSRMLESVSRKLNSCSALSYIYVREMRYFADNYDNKDSAVMYIEFRRELPVGLRFQAKEGRDLFVYDGKMTLFLEAATMTVDSASRTPAAMGSNSFLYNSLATIRNILPLIVNNDTFSKVETDTVVNGEKLVSIRIEAIGKSLGSLNGISSMSDTTRRMCYFLLADRETLLPYQYVVKIIAGNDDRDYIRITYKDIRVNPAAPLKTSWAYSSYRKRYQPFVAPVEVPVVKAGAKMPEFKLPLYSVTGSDSLSLQALKGKVVLVEFWFKSCGPCLKAMPQYNGMQQKFQSGGFELVTINIEDPVEDVAYFYKKYPPNYRMLYSGMLLFKALGFQGCPSSVLLDRDGRVQETFYGFDEQKIETALKAIL